MGDNPGMENQAASARLIIVCGLPGSGKTTLARALERKLAAIRFCPDEWMQALSLDIYDEQRRANIEALQWDLARKLLTQGLIVIIEWGTWGRSERDALREGARQLGAAVELHYLQVAENVAFERVQRRGMENPSITKQALSRWIQSFQPPSSQELALFDAPLLPTPTPTSE